MATRRVPYIRQKRVRKLSTHTVVIPEGSIVIPAVPVSEIPAGALGRAGLTEPAVLGESVLPTVLGGARSSSFINAEGRQIIDRSERETYSQTLQWQRREWRGNNPPETVTEFVDIARERYKRIEIPAPAERFTVTSGEDGSLWVTTTRRTLGGGSENALLHQVNLLLEHFGFCALADETLTVPVEERSVDWDLLPPGEQPFNQELHDLVRRALQGGPRQRPWQAHRLEIVAGHSPKLTAVGRAGMAGYVLFHFPQRGVHVLECGRYGNATYVISDDYDWETVTRMTKAELLSGGLVERRIIHGATSWAREMDGLLGG
jgi:hypothetical protein